ncbi:MAG: Do family serine endopeptidase [Alphaproteobacteria bacterium]
MRPSLRRWPAGAFAFVLALAFAWMLALPAQAAGRGAPIEGFADLVERLTPAVVNIASTSRPSGDAPPRQGDELEEIPRGAPEDEFFEYFGPEGQGGEPPYGELFPAASLGSGFIIDATGYVVTNNHVIADAEDISVVLDDGTRLKAKVVGRDSKTDLALLKVEAGQPLPYVKFGDSDKARVGDWIIAIGNPFGLGNSVSAGILSARGRDINAGPYDDFLQTDAPINRGNSGGPMFDIDGGVIGVNTLIYSPSGGSVGIGFATPSAIAKPVIEQLRKYGKTRRGWIGVRIQSVSDDLARRLGLGKTTGALVAGVIEGGPAAAAGIKPGDVILRFDGKRIAGRRDLPRIAADTEVGRNVDVVIWRDRKETTLKVAVARLEDYEQSEVSLSEAPPPRPHDNRGSGLTTERYDALGVTLADLTPELRVDLGLPMGVRGVVVVDSAGPSTDLDALLPGDLIIELDRQIIMDLEDLRTALEKRSGGPVVVLRQRANEREMVVIDPEDGSPRG